MPPCIEKTRRDPVATRDLCRRGTGPKRLRHQCQLLLAGPSPPSLRLGQDLRHRVYGHLKRARKVLLSSPFGNRDLTRADDNLQGSLHSTLTVITTLPPMNVRRNVSLRSRMRRALTDA